MKLFMDEYKGYIFTYYVGLIITLTYCKLMNFIKTSEIVYILFFNTFIVSSFIMYKYITTKKSYEVFENGIKSLDESILDLGKSPIGKNVSNILNQQYEQYRSNIQEQNKIHNDHITFINHWIHQMKTPVSVINLLLQEYEGEEISLNIHQELDKIDKGLNMAMYFARLDEFQKDFSVEKVNLYDDVIELINKERRLFIKNRIIPKLEIDKDLIVYSDKKWLRFILEQIIINGVKYSKDHGKYLIIKNREDDEYIIIDIIDEGIGIPRKDIKRVYEPFFTGENGRKFGESTGMGLYIVKKVCDNLGHTLQIKSEIEKGTKVSILFKK
ncbi:HAMP domain-containing histidine kinase [Paraclostridium ghonii]|uniref:histidine kinase n=1 Tax=Paraclostridium ghonii TaxID=29358 RepID=A0ABU0MZX7_9FIRM|nr:ATP-binding protein [Paeniclostridium ghonii]MDQ0556421.1 signal transduction histidine kinase [Paeniclostridium ghonii]